MSEKPMLGSIEVEAEEALLGVLLLDPTPLAALDGRLAAADFYYIRHGWIFEVMQELFRSGRVVEILAVTEALSRSHQLEEVGGKAYLTELQLRAPLLQYADAYVQMILEASYRRKALMFASDIATAAHEQTPEAIQRRIDILAERLRQALPAGEAYLEGRKAHEIYKATIGARLESEVPEGYPIHYDAFEPYVSTIKAGKIVVLSGFTGKGKTIFCEEWAEWLAMLGHKCLYITTELTIEDHLDRRYCRHSGIPYNRIIDPDEDTQRIVESIRGKLAWGINLDFWEYNGGGVDSVLAQMKRAREYGRRVFFIDYFWEILADDQRSTIEDAVRRIHAFAKEERTRSLVVVASQLSETEFGPRVYGTRRLDQKAALHIRLEPSEKEEVGAYFSVGDRIIKVRSDSSSPFTRAYIAKNTFGPSDESVSLFMDGERFSFIDSSRVNRTTVSLNEEIEKGPTPGREIEEHDDFLDDTRDTMNGIYRGGE